MCHEAAGLRTGARLFTDLLIEFVNVLRQMVVERLQFRSAMARVWGER
jgi:hypothetical protein